VSANVQGIPRTRSLSVPRSTAADSLQVAHELASPAPSPPSKVDGLESVEESALIARAQAGDITAFDSLIATHQAGAQRLAVMLGLHPDDAADAAQEAFVRAYRAIARFRLGEPFRPWLSSIVVNEVRCLRRSARRRAKLADRLGGVPELALDSPEGDAVRNERSARLLATLRSLRDHDRLPIVYRYFLDFSEAETATALGVPCGTVKSRLSRGLARLREALEDRP